MCPQLLNLTVCSSFNDVRSSPAIIQSRRSASGQVPSFMITLRSASSCAPLDFEFKLAPR